MFIQKGQCPASWKDANVVPIYKGSGKPKDDVGSYRPVSLTSVLCKVLEKLISVRMMDYINENNILSDDLFGFRRGRNCEQMLSKFFHVLSKSLDNHNCNLIDGVFLDFSSAFDKVDHNLLLRKLHSLGFRGSLLEWIQNFLLIRRQRVIFKGSLSEWCKVTSGVPQGSVLGPILFLLFVNDINDVVSSQLLQFADDHSIVHPICNEHDHNILQQDIQNIFKLTVLNKLPLNLSKCTVMHMTRLEKIQRKVTRISFYRRFACDADSRPSYIERLTELHLMKLEDVLKFSRLVFGYKLLNGHLPDSFGSLVQHSRLNSSRLLHLAAKTSSFFNSMFVTLPRLWNEIPSDIQDSKNLVAFKSGYRSFILNSYT